MHPKILNRFICSIFDVTKKVHWLNGLKAVTLTKREDYKGEHLFSTYSIAASRMESQSPQLVICATMLW